MELKPNWFQSCLLFKKGSRSLFFLGILLFITFSIAAQPSGDKVTLSFRNAPLETVFNEISKQTGHTFIYTTEQLRRARAVTINIKASSLQNTLDILFREQPFTYIQDGRHIAIKDKPEPDNRVVENFMDLRGIVKDEKGMPVPAASVAVKGTSTGTVTDDRGYFELRNINPDAILMISAVGFQTREIPILGRNSIEIQLPFFVSELDKTVVIAYGTTTRRLSTGSIGKVTAQEIEKQPVSNPLAALQGRIPGLLITQSSGVSGSLFNVQIRGQSSVGAYANAPYPVGNDPLYVIDGIPYNPGNKLNQILNASTTPGDARNGGLSPLNLINPSEIESIEVLKDADATAIYGSRGANGVILITTKKGKAGKPKLEFNFYAGTNKATRLLKFLNTSEYLSMRREAFKNDGVIPTAANAPDLLVYDTTAYTDFKKLFYGANGRSLDAQLNYSGGSEQTQFLIGAGYHMEEGLLPGGLKDKTPGIHLNFNHHSQDQKLQLGFSSSYSVDDNNLSTRDLTQYISSLPPNSPPLLDNYGNLKWTYNGVPFSNPFSYTFQKYHSKVDNLMSHLTLGFQPVSSINIRLSFGYSTMHVDENSITPKSSQNPQNNPLGYAEFSNRESRSWIIEPYVEYNKKIGFGKLNLVVGGTAQELSNEGTYLVGSNYTNDALLYSINSAGSITASASYSQYRYLGLFGRVNYKLRDKYLINITARRDGSSRFGPGKQFSNFGAAGFAWVFSNEKWFVNKVKFLSYGKLRTSYGTSGNDQIGDYIYLDTWTPTSVNYQGMPGIRPTALFNQDFKWELSRKYEAALDLGFLKDRILLSASYYLNRSSNQLISYRLPLQTGFAVLRAKNFPAVVQNSGFEFSIGSDIVKHRSFKWNVSANATIPRNKLIAFPDIASSSYANVYVVGQSLSVVRGYHYLGVDPQSGIYQFEDANKDNVLNSADYNVIGNLIPKYYGGFSNGLSFHQFQLDLFFEFRTQTGKSMAFYQNDAYPGLAYNQPRLILKRWQIPADISNIQKYTATPGSPAYIAALRFTTSDGVLKDASYARLKNLSFSYTLSPSLLNRLKLQSARIYFHAQNLITFTKYPGDPETQNYKILPPLRTSTIGVQLIL